METRSEPSFLVTGMAMFAMFFGSGNLVFPLLVGQGAGDQVIYAVVGLLISSILVPFLGLITMTLWDGNYHRFFGRIGRVPAFLIALSIVSLIGPFAVIPRCITVAYASINMFFPLGLQLFIAISCILVFICSWKEEKIVGLLGYVLTPLLLLCLAVIIILGLILGPAPEHVDVEGMTLFWGSLREGYSTMDLLAAFFFSSMVMSTIHKQLGKQASQKRLLAHGIKASFVGAGLLGLIYVGFILIAAFYAPVLGSLQPEELLAGIAVATLGPGMGLVACLGVALACLTTAMTLVAVFADFMKDEVFQGKVPYLPLQIGTLVISFFVASLEFSGIAAFLTPILQICYPGLIVLTVCNLLHKLVGWKVVKVPVYGTFLVSLVLYLA